jgi:hypothetical protein
LRVAAGIHLTGLGDSGGCGVDLGRRADGLESPGRIGRFFGADVCSGHTGSQTFFPISTLAGIAGALAPMVA